MASKLHQRYVLDSCALINFFQKSKGWQKVEDLLYEASQGKCTLFMSIINLGEVFYIRIREAGELQAHQLLQVIASFPIQMIDVNYDLMLSASRMKAKGGISYADCFAAAIAKKEKAIVVTTDTEFKVLEPDIKIMWL